MGWDLVEAVEIQPNNIPDFPNSFKMFLLPLISSVDITRFIFEC